MWTEVKRELVSMSMIFGIELKDAALAWYLSALEKQDPIQVLSALKHYAQTTKTRKMPLPAEIIGMISPDQDPDSLAVETASLIIGAIRKFGAPNGAEAKEYIGHAGWAVVQRSGGWGPLCEAMTDNQIPMYQAQFRELVKAEVRLNRSDIQLGQNIKQIGK